MASLLVKLHIVHMQRYFSKVRHLMWKVVVVRLSKF